MKGISYDEILTILKVVDVMERIAPLNWNDSHRENDRQKLDADHYEVDTTYDTKYELTARTMAKLNQTSSRDKMW